jgi:two-component system, NarL family, response regulator DevR
LKPKEDQTMTVAADPHIRPIELFEPWAAHIRLLIVDDHEAVRAGLRELLDEETDFEVVAALDSAEVAMTVAERQPIDVAVVDYQLGSRNGLWLSRKLKRLPSPPAVLVYSAYADGVLAAAAVVAEADAIVSKGGLGSELRDEIRRIARGGSGLRPLPEWLGDTIRKRFGPQEQAIFGMLLAGIAPPEVAETVGLSEAGLESRLWIMLRKLEAPHHDQRVVGGIDDAA